MQPRRSSIHPRRPHRLSGVAALAPANVLAALVCGPTAWGGGAVGVKFIDGQDTAWGTAKAGAPGYAQVNCNCMQTDWSGNAVIDTALASRKDSSGVPTSPVH